MYIADTFNYAVKEWLAANGNVVTLVSSGSQYPTGAAVDRCGNVYIFDGDYEVEKWSAASKSLVTLPTTGLFIPVGPAVDVSDNVYAASEGGDGNVTELPYAFVDPSTKFEPAVAGSDSLPPVLPVVESLLPPFAPSSDQSW